MRTKSDLKMSLQKHKIDVINFGVNGINGRANAYVFITIKLKDNPQQITGETV